MISKEEQVDNSLRVAYEKAAQVLRDADPAGVCSRTGAVFHDDCFSIPFIGQPIEIQMPGVEFSPSGPPLIAQVMILHYMTSHDVQPVRGDFVSFSGIPGGMFYHRSFQKRALDKFKGRFGETPEDLPLAGRALGGRDWIAGDYSSIVPVFPKIELVFQIYQGDDEFPAEANILFPDCVVNFLPVEDTAFLGGYLVGSLVRAAQ